ncbi:cGMP-dependent protein kinase 1 [Portunus trituberculatus]|uniref:cGMP-dependent protein kinase 1 n=1 Tax=Portunus trituberculatus TaxID=210409 RepID=A0A5B7FTY2_PORTR|nr:cGMP-dependent protein kinase 1 [Portunus trituberculatus]
MNCLARPLQGPRHQAVGSTEAAPQPFCQPVSPLRRAWNKTARDLIPSPSSSNLRRSKQLIKDAVMDNDFLKHLDVGQVREIVDSMYPQEFAAGSWVIREGDVGE